jgi:hypothetical protein
MPLDDLKKVFNYIILDYTETYNFDIHHVNV